MSLPEADNFSPTDVNISDGTFEIISEVDEEDKGRPVGAENLPPYEDDPNDSDRVRKRVQRLRAETHSERRAREQAERERNEAVELAKRLKDDNDRLRQNGQETSTALAASLQSDREKALSAAQEKLRAAHELGDSDAIAKATVEITTATTDLARIKDAASRLAPRREERGGSMRDDQQRGGQGQGGGQQPQPQGGGNRPTVAPNVAAWIENNKSWFGQKGFEQKTARAYSIHYRMEAEGVDPASSTYTETLDRELADTFDDHVPMKTSPGQGSERSGRDTPRRPDVVASGGRENGNSGGSRNIVRLTESELAIASKLGITPVDYAREKQKLNQGRGASA